ncbi:MAG TPA: DUF5987 family protein [Candidatus Eisenbacteria bacterium]|nr:DUF5987 family protein [Candidatus Eisenbacteria bacterium]
MTGGGGAGGVDRRTVLRGLAAGAAALAALPGARLLGGSPAYAAVTDDPTVSTLEAFADTLIPGEKRTPDDRAVAGVVPGPGAVQAGAIALLQMPEAQVASYLPGVAALLDTHADAYAAQHGRPLDPTVPPFVALDFPDRTALCRQLVATGQPVGQEQQIVTLFALLSFVAFHCAGQEHTAEAIASGHPGLAWLRFPAPDPDGLYRFPDFSYRRRLARPHPDTTRSGSPA